MLGQRYECAAAVAICDPHRRLMGLVRLEDLLAAGDSSTMRALMDADPPVAAPGTDQEVAAWKAVRHGQNALAVVDAQGTFAGLIPAERLMGVLLWEHDEDLARLGGFARDTASAKECSSVSAALFTGDTPLRAGHGAP